MLVNGAPIGWNPSSLWNDWGAVGEKAIFEPLDGDNTMLRKLMRAPLLLLLGFQLSCTRAPSVAEANRLLEGHWELALGHDCSDYGIRSDNLVLHSDGTLEQHFVSIYNQRYDTTNQHWSYSPENHVNFDIRRNFFTKQPPTEVIGVPIPENLIVEFGNPPVILVHPDSDCFYRKVAGQ